jgi:hypothetical protein
LTIASNITFVTPMGGLLALTVVPPVFAFAKVAARNARGTAMLRLPPQKSRRGVLAAVAVVPLLLGLAAAGPAWRKHVGHRIRTDAQAVFVFDTSRSMAASATPASPTRLDRAIEAAVQLRASIPQVPSGIATLTDRVLPNLLPVPDPAGFDGVARRAVAIESPPPRDQSVRATTYAALAEIASGNYFEPAASRRIVVLLTDGESNPVDGSTIAGALPAAKGYRLVAIRFWAGNEAVYGGDGKPEAAYRPDPSGLAVLDGLAAALSGGSFTEGRLGAASSTLRSLAGQGPTVRARGASQSRMALAPFVVAAALLLLLLTVLPFPAQGVLQSVRLTRQ